MRSPFWLKKLSEGIATIFIVVTLTFFILRLLPGGPFDSETALDPQIRQRLEAQYGLDLPVHSQYLRYVGNLARGDLGESYQYTGQNISELLADALPVTVGLGLMSLVFSFLAGIPLGLWTAAAHRTRFDAVALIATISAMSLPSFLTGPLLVLIFSFWLDWLPPALWDSPRYYILPVATLSIRPMAMVARLVRASVLEVIHSDYVRAARAKGLGENRILFKHILRNSVIPITAIAGSLVANVLMGSLIVEMIFAVPGIARHFVDSVVNRDYPLVLALTIAYSVILVVGNMLMDLVSSAVDPRIRLG
jgi:oligopeptide transport system permease protein